MQLDKLMKYLKLIPILFLLINNNNITYSKPVPPGAGDGDVAANILFLVDSSASMGRWIGGDGLGGSTGVTYDSEGRILIGQNARRTAGGLIRYTAAGDRDRNFRPIRAIPAAGCTNRVNGTRNEARQRLRRVGTVKFLEGLTGAVNEDIIFINSRERWTRNYIFGFSEDGNFCRIAIAFPSTYFVGDFDIKTIGGVPYLFANGWDVRRRVNTSIYKSCNLQTLQCNDQTFMDWNVITRNAFRQSVNNEGTMVYFSHSGTGDLRGHTLTQTGGTFNIGAETRRCTAVNDPTLSSQVMSASGVEVSPDNSNIVYISSHLNHAVQKLELDDDTCTVVTSVGMGVGSIASNSGTANAFAGDSVSFSGPWGLHVTSTRILTSTSRGYVDEFDEDLFTVAARNTTWLQQMGGPRLRRWDGVKQAINAIVNDTTLTSGAYFGFGHWNAGEHGRSRGAARGGRYCHRNADCTYYQGWGGFSSTHNVTEETTENDDGTTTTTTTSTQTDTGSQSRVHPLGTSSQCNRDSCLNVAVSSKGAGLIMDVLNPLGMAWGTDSHAFHN